MPSALLQLPGLGLEVPQGCRAGVLEHSVLGGQREVLEQAAKVAAAAENVIARVPLLGLLTQCVHQLLPYHDDQLALRDEDLGGLAVAQAVVKYADGFEEGPKIEPAVFGKVESLLGVLLTQRPGCGKAKVLEKGRK